MLGDIDTVSQHIAKDVVERVKVAQKALRTRAKGKGLIEDTVPIFGIEDLGSEFEIRLMSDDKRLPGEIFKEWFDGHKLEQTEREKLN